MKPSIVADEMFPEGAGPYMDIEELGSKSRGVELLPGTGQTPKIVNLWVNIPASQYLTSDSFIYKAGGSSALLMDLAANEKSVHADFFNDFDDLFDDTDLS